MTSIALLTSVSGNKHCSGEHLRQQLEENKHKFCYIVLGDGQLQAINCLLDDPDQTLKKHNRNANKLGEQWFLDNLGTFIALLKEKVQGNQWKCRRINRLKIDSYFPAQRMVYFNNLAKEFGLNIEIVRWNQWVGVLDEEQLREDFIKLYKTNDNKGELITGDYIAYPRFPTKYAQSFDKPVEEYLTRYLSRITNVTDSLQKNNQNTDVSAELEKLCQAFFKLSWYFVELTEADWYRKNTYSTIICKFLLTVYQPADKSDLFKEYGKRLSLTNYIVNLVGQGKVDPTQYYAEIKRVFNDLYKDLLQSPINFDKAISYADTEVKRKGSECYQIYEAIRIVEGGRKRAVEEYHYPGMPPESIITTYEVLYPTEKVAFINTLSKSQQIYQKLEVIAKEVFNASKRMEDKKRITGLIYVILHGLWKTLGVYESLLIFLDELNRQITQQCILRNIEDKSLGQTTASEDPTSEFVSKKLTLFHHKSSEGLISVWRLSGMLNDKNENKNKNENTKDAEQYSQLSPEEMKQLKQKASLPKDLFFGKIVESNEKVNKMIYCFTDAVLQAINRMGCGYNFVTKNVYELYFNDIKWGEKNSEINNSKIDANNLECFPQAQMLCEKFDIKMHIIKVDGAQITKAQVSEYIVSNTGIIAIKNKIKDIFDQKRTIHLLLFNGEYVPLYSHKADLVCYSKFIDKVSYKYKEIKATIPSTALDKIVPAITKLFADYLPTALEPYQDLVEYLIRIFENEPKGNLANCFNFSKEAAKFFQDKLLKITEDENHNFQSNHLKNNLDTAIKIKPIEGTSPAIRSFRHH